MRAQRFSSSVWIGLSVAAVASAANARTLPSSEEPRVDLDDEVVVTAFTSDDWSGDRLGLPLVLVPQSLQVVTSQELEARSARTIGDALRSVPSANVGSPRGVPFQNFAITIRGFAADQMRNGVRQRYYENVDPSALSNVERIEVLKGPSAVLFGESAVGGIVSIVTKRPLPQWAGQVTAAVGSFDEARTSLDVTGPLVADGGLGFRLTGEVERSDTSVDFVPLKRDNVALTLSSVPMPGVTGFLVAEWTARRSVGNPGLPPLGTVLPNGIAPIPRHRNLNEPSFAFLDLDAPLVQAWVDVSLGGDWTVTPRASWNGYHEHLARTGLLDVLADRRTVRRFAFAERDDGDFLITQLDLAGRARTGRVEHDLRLGGEWADESLRTHFDQPDTVAPIDVLKPVYGGVPGPPWPRVFQSNSKLRSIALYAQDVVRLGAIHLVLGARHARFETITYLDDDRDRGHFDELAWQAGGTWAVIDGLSLFGGYNTGFDVESTAGARSASGRSFDPETSHQAELGLRLSHGSVRGSASVFRIARNNVLTPDPLDQGFSIQTGRQRVGGVEIEGRWQPVVALSLQGGFAHLAPKVVRSNNGDAGDRIADVARNQANIFVAFSPARQPGLTLRAGMNYVGARRLSNARVPIGPGLLASDVRLPDYVVTQFGLEYAVGRLRIDLSVTNAFDRRYFVHGGPPQLVYAGEPRTVELRIGHRF